ncbi:TetR/AcrR family transcriptional regulator [Nocardia sp. CA2R105]|uniref:TetR/AcrR family transcriptional regulator n=1 Tax=Nocardia coffeae TaxID=2873381 RepID=UPI001CA64BF7|nr:TetR/AcrR family transcriptional regulator [Nocardia coffeae]MBY8862296.1 TetR/AcrR family transcriptional regulator [Nocardia coffeae]
MESELKVRRDAARNRMRLLDAAREIFARDGHDVPLEEVARAASVSRTTLYRHFTTREELAATIFEENVVRIEQRAAELRECPRGVVDLFDFVLDMQLDCRSMSHVLFATNTIEWFSVLSGRTADAFGPLLERGRVAGVVRPAVDVYDVMMAFRMAEGPIADGDGLGRTRTTDRVRAMLHRGLFTTTSSSDSAD